jgi:hypothetical protein
LRQDSLVEFEERQLAIDVEIRALQVRLVHGHVSAESKDESMRRLTAR